MSATKKLETEKRKRALKTFSLPNTQAAMKRRHWAAEERKFSGHLTLCRVRNTKAGVKLARLMEDYKNFKAGGIKVESVAVYQSQLTPTGPIYTVLGRYNLQ